jgi:CRP-like cAMP-binding protein
LFAQTLKAEQLDMLSAAAEPVSFEQGAVIMTQGTQDNSMFVILEGAARVRASLPDAAVVREIAIIASGDIVGEMSLMTGAPRSATVTAMTALRTLKITKPTIEMLLADTPELLDRFSAILAARQAGLTAQADRPESWDFVQRDLLARMRTFFARAFSGSDKKVV